MPHSNGRNGNIFYRWCVPCILKNIFYTKNHESDAPAEKAQDTYSTTGFSQTKQEQLERSYSSRTSQSVQGTTLSGIGTPDVEPNSPGGIYVTRSGTSGVEFTQKGLKAFDRGDFDLARSQYEVAAAEGDAYALHNLATMYLHGQGIEKDETKAFALFMECSRNGLYPSMSQLGYIYLYGRGVKRDVAQAKLWFSQAKDDAYAQFHLGMMYFLGIGMPRDASQGCRWLRQSAKGGFVPAMYNLGLIYMQGLGGVAQNLDRAVTLFKRAALLDDPYAQTNLATMYASGQAVKQDYRKAHALFRRAAKRGISEASFNLGEMYAKGLGVSPDITAAARYYLRAVAVKQNSDAEFSLATIFLTGRGPIQQDLDLSRLWFEKAAMHGHRGAQNNAEVLRSPRFTTPPVTVVTSPPKAPSPKPRIFDAAAMLSRKRPRFAVTIS